MISHESLISYATYGKVRLHLRVNFSPEELIAPPPPAPPAPNALPRLLLGCVRSSPLVLRAREREEEAECPLAALSSIRHGTQNKREQNHGENRGKVLASVGR